MYFDAVCPLSTFLRSKVSLVMIRIMMFCEESPKELEDGDRWVLMEENNNVIRQIEASLNAILTTNSSKQHLYSQSVYKFHF